MRPCIDKNIAYTAQTVTKVLGQPPPDAERSGAVCQELPIPDSRSVSVNALSSR